jgi:hypothetical protein
MRKNIQRTQKRFGVDGPCHFPKTKSIATKERKEHKRRSRHFFFYAPWCASQWEFLTGERVRIKMGSLQLRFHRLHDADCKYAAFEQPNMNANLDQYLGRHKGHL